jgi:transposase InsO family protein
VSGGFHVCLDAARVLLHRVLRGRVLPPHPRVARDDHQDHGARDSVLEQALFTRRYSEFQFTATGLVHHSDAGSQYTAIAFTEALREAGITSSIGSVGDALANALMESAVGLYKSELIGQHPAFTGRAELERETASCGSSSPMLLTSDHQA